MIVRSLNRWKVDYHGAVRIQDRLAGRVVCRGTPRGVRHVAGADVSYEKSDNRFYAAVVVMRFPQMEPVEVGRAVGQATFPYIPGLLTFREGPILLRAFRKLKHKPDLVLFDGQGVAHPRGLGLAAHMGLTIDLPSIGCAKSRLCGEHDEPSRNVDDWTRLTLNGRLIGRVVRTRKGVKPLFVSVGHRISLPNAVAWVLRTTRGFRLPEPTRQAHRIVNEMRREAKG